MIEILGKLLIIIVIAILAVKTPLGGILVTIASFIVRVRIILAILVLLFITALVLSQGAGV